jgi:hypothetical protein
MGIIRREENNKTNARLETALHLGWNLMKSHSGTTDDLPPAVLPLRAQSQYWKAIPRHRSLGCEKRLTSHEQLSVAGIPRIPERSQHPYLDEDWGRGCW